METQEWINEVIKSTEGIVKISPDDSLFFKIQSRINENKLSSNWIWLAAASFAIVVMLNVKFVFSTSNSNEDDTEILASTMTQSNQLY